MTRSLQLFSLFIALILTSSCNLSKKVPYLQDAASYTKQKIPAGYQVTIGNDDLLSIAVSSKDTLLAQPFNRVPGGQGYLVNTSGSIFFPLFGEIKVAGQTPADISDFIKARIIREGFIKDPAVVVRLLNFKISVMGEVNKPGVYSIAGGRVTVMEALALAGDMSVYGRRNKVLVIREEGGQRELQYVDVNSTALFNSPYYYLRQNDVVYVEPNQARAAESEYNTRMPMILTAATVLTSIVSLIILISK